MQGPDWIGLYVNGLLTVEGHSLTPLDVTAALGIPATRQYCNPDWIECAGSLPEKLEDVHL